MAEADFGSDLSGVTDLSPTLEESSGYLCVAQRVARRWLQPKGGLWHDPSSGGDLMKALNAPFYKSRLEPRLRMQAEMDEAVESAEVVASFTEATRTLEVLGRLILVDSSELQFSLVTNGVTTTLLLGS
jgi:hypothetical protein